MILGLTALTNTVVRRGTGARRAPRVVPARGSRRPIWRQRRGVQAGLLLADVAAVCLGVVVQSSPAGAAYAYAAGVLAMLMLSGAYRVRLNLQTLDEVPRLSRALVLPLLPFLVQEVRDLGMLLQLTVTAFALVLARAAVYGIIRALRRRGRLLEATVIVGAGQVGEELAALLAGHREYGLLPVGFVDSVDVESAASLSLPLLGRTDELDGILRRLDLHRVIVAFGPVRDANWIGVLRTAIANDVEVHIVPRFFDIGLRRAGVDDDDIWGIPLYRVRRTAVRSATWRLKRLIDVVVAAVALLLAAPLMAVIALAVRLSSPGPLLFRQPRLGQNGRQIEMLKFRTLRQEHSSHTSNTLTGLTPVGAWLRRLSLDELPQLWNVLRGDMSLIGPRPERRYFVELYSTQVPGYGDRHRLPVGLTGWSQIHGLRGDTSIHHRARFDNAYIEGWSLWLDITILLRTAGAVLRDAVQLRRGSDRPEGGRVT